MTTTNAIQQCPQCFRYLAGGQVVGLSLGEAAAACREDRIVSELCGREDCLEMVQATREREQNRRQRAAICRVTRRERHEVKQDCRVKADGEKRTAEATASHLSSQQIGRMPYKDADLIEPASSQEPAIGFNVGSLVEKSLAAAPATPKGLSQHEFAASGKADTANARLREFFNFVVASGQVGNWFSRKFLKEVCKNDYINNRIDDLRPVFGELGIKIVNGEVSPAADLPKSSHYRLLLMSDAEMEKFRETQNPPVE